jgi:hypothetical protein
MVEKLGGGKRGNRLKEKARKKDGVKLRDKSGREDFFYKPRRMPEGLDVPDELETEFKKAKPHVPGELEKEFKEAKPEVSEELQEKIDKEWEVLTEEYPVSQ